MGYSPPCTASMESRNGVGRIALSGELDIAAVPVIEQSLGHFEQNGVSAIMVDLRDVTFMDTSAVHVFLEARNRAGTTGRRLILVGGSESARRVFELTRTRFLIDEQEAVSVIDRFTGWDEGGPGRAAQVDGEPDA